MGAQEQGAVVSDIALAQNTSVIVVGVDMGSKGGRVEELARKLSYALIAKAAEGLSIASLRHLSEATFQDALILPCMAHGSQQAREWWVETERSVEVENKKLATDLAIMERSSHKNTKCVGAIEVKWWRDRSHSKANASNRRKMFLLDIIRAGALSNTVDGFALVCLVTTKRSWDMTVASNNTPDATLIRKVDSASTISTNKDMFWLAKDSVIQQNRIPVPSSLHVRRLHESSLRLNEVDSVVAKVWEVRKPQKSTWLKD